MPELSSSLTLRDLDVLSRESVPMQIALGIPRAQTHQRRLQLVEMALDHIFQDFTKTRQHRFKRSEDELTADIIFGLTMLGFKASHDTQFGGHVDVVIEMGGSFLWLGEAKVHRSYDDLLQGFLQLSTRYSTGLPGQDVGGLIIYCKGRNAGGTMDEWMSRLNQSNPAISIEPAAPRSLVRLSSHCHQVSGSDFRVRHMAVPLHFDPQDK